MVAPAAAQLVDTVRIINDATLSQPLFLTAPTGDASRLFVLEQSNTANTARIRIYDNAGGFVGNFLTITGIAGSAAGNERGALGLAFHPDYASNGMFYVNVTNTAGANEIRRYHVSSDANVAETSFTTLLTINRTAENHNGGWIGFRPGTNHLYIASGDSGGGNDPGNVAQNLTEFRGKILAIDVGTTGTADEFASAAHNYAIPSSNPFAGNATDVGNVLNAAGQNRAIWDYGLRNPWRPSFDALTGDLIIADVGQGAREEINFESAASSGGINYGWRAREGLADNTSVSDSTPGNAVDPILDFERSVGTSITGGYVYRGPISALDGLYFFGDFGSGRVWTFDPDAIGAPGTITNSSIPPWITERTSDLFPALNGGTLNTFELTSFGQDGLGNLYLISRSGEVFLITSPVPEPGPLAMLGLAGVALAYWRSRTRRSAPQ